MVNRSVTSGPVQILNTSYPGELNYFQSQIIIVIISEIGLVNLNLLTFFKKSKMDINAYQIRPQSQRFVDSDRLFKTRVLINRDDRINFLFNMCKLFCTN